MFVTVSRVNTILSFAEKKSATQVNVKHRKPETFDGKKDHMDVESWIYSVESNLQLVQVGMQDDMSELENIWYAVTIFSKSAEICGLVSCR